MKKKSKIAAVVLTVVGMAAVLVSAVAYVVRTLAEEQAKGR